MKSAKSSFENLAHRDQVLQGIVAGVLPLKFAYAGSAADTHQALAKSENYAQTVGSARHEASTLVTYMPISPKALQLVDVGPGDGRHTCAFVESAAALRYKPTRYLALDFSGTLIETAMTNIAAKFGSYIAMRSKLWDIEASPTSTIGDWRERGAVLAIMLGHTLGNVEEPQAVLLNLSRSLKPGDILLLGLAAEVQAATDEIYLAPYRTDVFRRAALEPLRAAGFDLDAIDFRLRYEHRAVIGYAILDAAMTVANHSLPVGHEIRCFLSRRFNIPQIEQLLLASGWTFVRAEHDRARSHLAIVAQRRART